MSWWESVRRESEWESVGLSSRRVAGKRVCGRVWERAEKE